MYIIFYFIAVLDDLPYIYFIATVLAQYALPRGTESIPRVAATVPAATVYIFSQKSAATVNSPVKTPSRTEQK